LSNLKLLIPHLTYQFGSCTLLSAEFRKRRNMVRQKAKAWCAAAALLVTTASPFVPTLSAQRDSRDHQNYYDGMRDHVRDKNYEDRNRRDERQHHHDDSGGGIGPGYGAAIGGAGGAALGAVFGGGLKGALIGGAAGAGLGALGGKLAQGNDNNDRHHH
jgi:hypothetical protein